MKAVILNGARPGEDDLSSAQAILTEEFSRGGWSVEAFVLRGLRIQPCVGCFGCWVQTPGLCLVDDASRDVARAFIRSDLAVFLTPVTFGGYSSELKKALDRIICLVSPYFKKISGEVHHRTRYDRYPCLLAVGFTPEPDPESEQIFRTLVSRNAINMHSPSHRACVLAGRESPGEIRAKLAPLLTEFEVAA